MIFETMMVGTMLAGTVYYRATMNSRFIKSYQRKLDSITKELNIKNTFKINELEFIENGFISTLIIPTGYSIDTLEKNIKSIENHYRAKVHISNIEFSNMCKMKVINKELLDYPFKPVQLKENELLIGKTYDGKDYILDMNKNSHLLILGATGKGKTVELMMILSNLIYNSSKNIEIHLSQIAKSETGMLRDCPCVKFYGNRLEDVALDLERVSKLVNYRSKVFDNEGVSNIQEYNKYNTKRKMKRIYYVIEEVSFFMPQSSDLDEIKDLKAKCWSSILEIVKAGRSCGIHFLSVSQRSTTTNLPSDVKSQMTRISFTQISKVDSQNAIECDLACSLKDRQCLIYGDSRPMEIIKVPYLKDGYISLHEFVKEIRIPKKLSLNKNNDELKEDNSEAAIGKENNNVEKVFYEDRKINDEELEEYLSNTGVIKRTPKVIKDKRKNTKGIIKGGGKRN